MKPLTAAEAKWVEELEGLLAKCPSNRIGAFTIGDDYIMLYDRSFDNEICDIQNSRNDNDFAAVVDSLECGFGIIHFPFPVHAIDD